MHSQFLNSSGAMHTAAVLQLPEPQAGHLSFFSHNPSINHSFAGLLSLTTLWRSLFVLLVLGNLKNIPFMWTLRIVNAFRFCLRSQRPKVAPSSDQIFKPLITVSQCPLMEIDFNLHKTNSSYFSDVDVARTHLFCTLFSPGIEVMRGGCGAFTGSKGPMFGIALGAVSCSFKKELKPYETYELWTRILSWDSKWIFVLTHFVRKDKIKPRRCSLYPEQNEEKSHTELEGDLKDNIVASALSRCVFKQGRKTISPELMLQLSGLLPSDSPAEKKNFVRSPTTMSGEDAQSELNLGMGEKASLSITEKIEMERLRGLKVASALAAQGQQELEREFAGDDVLGTHTDGTGITGVVSTLCQLAHLKRDQIL